MSKALPKLTLYFGPTFMRHSSTSLPTPLTLDRFPDVMPDKGCPDLARCPGVETVEPSTEWTAASVVYVFSDLDHIDMVIPPLP